MQDRSDVTNDAEGNVCSLGVWQTCLQLAMRAVHAPTLVVDEFQDALTRAELAEEISEFYALGVQAIFNLANESGFAGDYLAMAELVIGSTTERTVMTHWRTLQQQMELQRGGGPECIPALLGRRAQTLDDESLAALGVAVLETLRHASRGSHRRPDPDLLATLAPPLPIQLAFSSSPRVAEGSNRPRQTGDASLLQGTPPSGTTLYPRAQTGT
jgi:hypothetical protein